MLILFEDAFDLKKEIIFLLCIGRKKRERNEGDDRKKELALNLGEREKEGDGEIVEYT